MQSCFVRRVRQDVLFEGVVAQLGLSVRVWGGLRGGRDTDLSHGGPVVVPQPLRELLWRLSCSFDMAQQPALADLGVALWGVLDGPEGVFRRDNEFRGCEGGNEDDASVGLEREGVWRGGVPLERLPLEYSIPMRQSTRRRKRHAPLSRALRRY